MPPPSPEPAGGAPPRVLTVPFGAAFLEALADGLLDGGLIPGVALRGDPAALAGATIFLPTRRSGAALVPVLVDRLGGAALLPRILPLGEAEDEDDLAAADALVAAAPQRPIAELDRRLVLARLVQRWAKSVGAATVPREPGDALLIPGSPADAVALAAELARLIDSFATENVPWSRLAGLVPEDLDVSWQLTTRFLAIAAEWWPDYLAGAGLADRAALRNARLDAFARRLAAHPPAGPVIVAGSTGSNPATAAFMATVARLPQGAVVLPGLDRGDLDAAGWAAAAAEEAPAWTHPQHGLARTLALIGIDRAAVTALGAAPDWGAPRRRLIAEALRPAATTEAWAAHPLTAEDTVAALAHVRVVAAETEQEEALAAAVLLREALAVPGRRAALVTPDRRLARRVAAALARWGLAVADSAGLPLSETPAGVLARLIADAAAADLAAAAVLPLLKHPDATLGRSPAAVARAAAVIELAALRGPRPRAGAAGLHAALAEGRRRAAEDRHAHPALRALRPWEWDAAAGHLARLATALEPLCSLTLPRLAQRGEVESRSDRVRGGSPSPGASTEDGSSLSPQAGRGSPQAPPTTTLAALAGAHAEALAAIAADGLDCDAVLAALDAIAAADGADLPLTLAEYPALIARLLGWETARRPAAESRVVILGTLEARLLSFDRVVLGGLVEGTWPPAAHNDPWLSRPMRTTLGLPPPEWRIGLSAHDFQEMLGTRDVVLTRSAKVDGAPTVAARWLQRLAVVGGAAWAAAEARGAAAIALARSLDAVDAIVPTAEPMPRPALALRPARLSVTAIETLIRDPYAIYAQRILRLEPLEPVAAPPDAGDRGEIMHAAFARFVAAGIDPAAPDARERLLAIGLAEFAPLEDRPEIRAFWWPRFCRAADWFLGWSRGRSHAVAESFVEGDGRLVWQTAAGRDFALTARADRFDWLKDDTLAVIDYKTGSARTAKEVAAGIAPQLPLEAAMAMRGAFAGLPPAAAVSDLLYVRLSGGREPGRETPVANGDAAALAESALAGAKELIDRYEDESFPYRSLRHPLFRYRDGGPYEHLARVQEWARTGEEEDEP